MPRANAHAEHSSSQRSRLLPLHVALRYFYSKYPSDTRLPAWKTVFRCLEMLLCVPGIDLFLIKMVTSGEVFCFFLLFRLRESRGKKFVLTEA